MLYFLLSCYCCYYYYCPQGLIFVFVYHLSLYEIAITNGLLLVWHHSFAVHNLVHVEVGQRHHKTFTNASTPTQLYLRVQSKNHPIPAHLKRHFSLTISNQRLGNRLVDEIGHVLLGHAWYRLCICLLIHVVDVTTIITDRQFVLLAVQ